MPGVNPYTESLPTRYPHIFPVSSSHYGSMSTSPPFSHSTSLSKSDPEPGIAMAPFNSQPGARFIIKGPPNRRGTLLNSSHKRGTCTRHDHTTNFYLIRVDWPWWPWSKIIFMCFWCPFWLSKYVIINLSKFILKYTGILFCVSRLFQGFTFPQIPFIDSCTNFYNKLLHNCRLYLGWEEWVCVEDMEKESVFDDRISRKKGIQWFNNSCYLDALLFSMFFGSNAFDAILEDTQNSNAFSKKIKKILLTDIAAPLRYNDFVPARNVWKLRENLKHLNPSITGSFMAIEDIVYLLFELALDLPSFLEFSVGDPNSNIVHMDHMHIMRVNYDDHCPVITIQKNFETSLKMNGDMKLLRVPSPALILSLPWEEDKLFHHEAILPTFELDLRPLLTDWGKICTKCGEFEATYESVGDEATVSELLCDECTVKVEWVKGKYVSRTKMNLAALICYRGAHYTTFARKKVWLFGDSVEYEWLRFDSMSGGSPTVILVKELAESVNLIIGGVLSGGKLPSQMTPHQKAFCCDGHTCIYEPQFYNPHLS